MAARPDGIPAGFIEMDPKLVQKAIASHKPVLADEQKKLEALYKQHKYCPHSCGPTMEKVAGPTTKWAFQDSLVPRCLLKCHICGCVLNPHDGMIVELGDKDKFTARSTGAHIINVDKE